MTIAEYTKVLVVGAGPVGLSTGALLRRQGVEALVVDKASGPTPYSKAIGVHARTLEGMHALGLTERMISKGNPLSAFGIFEKNRPVLSGGFKTIDSAYSFVLGITQSTTERLLLEALQTSGGDVEWGTSLVSIVDLGQRSDVNRKARAIIRSASGDEREIHADWIIGADGGRSSVRDMSGIAFPGGHYGKAFILGDVELDWDGPRRELQFHLGAKGYLLIVPMPDGLFRIIAQTSLSYDDFQRTNKPTATLEELQAIVDHNGPGGIQVHSPRWLTSAPFYFRIADSFTKQRILLVGDAAHMFSPLGAQGLNTGFQDAFNLAWKIGVIDRGLANVDLLDSYESERRSIAQLVARITAKTTALLTETSPIRRFALRQRARRMNPRPEVQRTLPTLLAGLLQKYGASGELGSPSAAGLVETGDRVPHAFLARLDDYKPLAALIHGQDFKMLHLLRRATPESVFQVTAQWSEANRQSPSIFKPLIIARELSRDVSSAGISIVEDRLGTLFNDKLTMGDAACIAVRPDGYCSGSAHGLSCLELLHPLNRFSAAPSPA